MHWIAKENVDYYRQGEVTSNVEMGGPAGGAQNAPASEHT